MQHVESLTAHRSSVKDSQQTTWIKTGYIMRIDNNKSNPSVLKELGRRLASERLRQGRTQASLATDSGVSKRTIERIESGHSAQIGSVISLLRALSLLERLEQLLPLDELPTTGLYLLDLPIERIANSRRRRESPNKTARKPRRQSETAKSSTLDV